MIFQAQFFFPFLVFITVVGASFTNTIGEPGVGLAGRLTISDFLLLPIIFAGFIVCIFRKGNFRITSEYIAFLPLLFVFMVSACLAHSPDKALVELLIHSYIFLFSIAMLQFFPQNIDLQFVRRVLLSAVFGAYAAALYGLIIFFFFPSYNTVEGGLAAGFRNTGQAGNFFFTFSCIGIASLFSKFIKRNLFNLHAILTIVVALIFTGKRASLIGLMVSLFLLILLLIINGRRKEDLKDLLYFTFLTVVCSFFVFILVMYSLDQIDGVAWRFDNKFTGEGLEAFYDNFYVSNLIAGLNAFIDNPFLGVGLGNIEGNYHEFEIHSTYLAILATTGVFGFVAFFYFVFCLSKRFFVFNYTNYIDKFFFFFSPFFISMLVTWSYTYTIRKREFWILMFILATLKFFRTRSTINAHSDNSKY
jgi:O-antigen ligase